MLGAPENAEVEGFIWILEILYRVGREWVVALSSLNNTNEQEKKKKDTIVMEIEQLLSEF